MFIEKYCKYVSSRGIAQNCDKYPVYIKSDSIKLNLNDYQNIKNNDIVYVISSTLKEFVNIILPILEKKKIRIKLITGACVMGVPNELSRMHNIDYINRFFTNSNSIIKWYTQNYDSLIVHPNIVAIPLGLDYHTLHEKTYIPWGPQATAKEQDEQIDKLYTNSLPFNERLNKTFSYYHFAMFNRHGRDRYMANEALKHKNFNDFLSNKEKRNKTWELCTTYKYVISPHGNGLDCHRTYEALILGCIPIVRSSSLDIIYKDMPIIILNNWNEINIESLLEKSEEVLKKGRERLTLKYWIDLIKNT